MSLHNSSTSEADWFEKLLGVSLPEEGKRTNLRGQAFVTRRGILRQESLLSKMQEQTKNTFGFKWKKRETFESAASLQRMRAWLVERYGDIANASWWDEYPDLPLVVDAGCGAGMSGLELFGEMMHRIRYLGVDVSEAIDVAAARFAEKKLPGSFVQADLMNLPAPRESVDVIFSEGVLHHTDSTEAALKGLTEYLRPGGRFLFYVYKKKGPIREFTDDFIRERLAGLPSQEAWDLLMPLSKLGEVLGQLDVTVTVPEDVELLDIPAGDINLQRLFYWHVFKAFYSEELDLDELNHINFDWYAPRNAHRQSPEEVRRWCEEAGLEIERERVENAGITIIAKKK